MRSKNAFKNLVFYFIYEISLFICGIVFPRIIILTYGSSINGLTSTITRILSLINLVQAGAIGTAIYQMYKPVAENDFETQSSIIYSSKLFYRKTSIIYLSIALAVGIFYGFYLQDGNLSFLDIFLSFVLLAINGTSILLFNSICDIYISSHQKRYFLSISAIFEIVVRYGLLSIILFLKLHFIFIYVCYLIGGIASVALNLFFYFRLQKGKILKNPKNKNFVIPNRKYLMLSSIGSEIVTASPTIIITSIIDLVQSSVFSIYALVFTSMKTILNSIQLSFSAIFGNLTKTSSSQKIYSVYSMIELITIFLGTIVSSCVGFLIIPFIQLYTNGADTNYLSIILCFFVIAYTVLISFRSSFGYVANVYGLFRHTCVIILAFGLTGVFISVLMVILFGMPFVMVGLLFNQLGCSIAILIVLKRRISWFKIKKLFIRSGLMITMTALSVAMFFILNPIIDSWSKWVFYGAVVSVVAVLLLVVYCLLFEREHSVMFFCYLKNLIKKRENI